MIDMQIVRIVEYSIAFITLYFTVFIILLYIKYRNSVSEKPRIDKKFTPRLSVIIPAFNEEDTLEHCVKSLVDADYPKEELDIIIVDDGSKDKTYAIAKLLSNRYKNVRCFTKKNEGKAAALNYAITRADGEIIATLDADSFIEKDTIWRMLPYFKDKEVAAVTAAVKVNEQKNKGKAILEFIQKIEYLFTLFSRKVLVFIEAVTVTPGPFSMFRSWVFKKVGMFDTKSILEDQEIALRIQKHNYKIRSSMDAGVYTEIPRNFNELLKQRIRWHRGGFHNTLKYLSLISPRYGDFGLIIMPLTFIAIITLFGVFFVAIANIFTQPYYFRYLGLEASLLSLTPIHIVGLIILALNVLWIAWGLLQFKKEKISAWQLIIYIISYSYLLTIYWTAAIIKEIKMEKPSW